MAAGLPGIKHLQRTFALIGAPLWKTREIYVILGAYLAYMVARQVLLGDVSSVATDNASKLISFQKHLGILWEPGWQTWVIDHARWLAVAMNWTYFMTFFPIIAITAVIFYLRDRPRYYYYRNIVLLSFVVALLVFIFFPLAPPRFMPNFVDTIQVFGPSQYGGREMAWFYNVYAAMPSLHFGWAVLFGVLYWRTRGSWLFKVVGVAYPTMTFFAITITGNHYILDAVGGIGVLLISYLIYAVILRRHAHLPAKLFLATRQLARRRSDDQRPGKPWQGIWRAPRLLRRRSQPWPRGSSGTI